MIDLTNVKHHRSIEEIVNVLCNKTQNTDRGFFRSEAAYFIGKMASTMRVTIVTKDRGEIPVNIYALLLATSGYGKGHSVNIIENEFLGGFKKTFMEDCLPVISEQYLRKMSQERALRNGTDPDEELEKLEREFRNLGAYPFTFDSGTTPAVKQLRQKLLMAGVGAINLQIDEIGSNLIGNVEILNLFLELYDQGMVKQKLTKVTVDNQRGEELEGKTPANMMLFGTPAKLLDGGQTEDQFYSFLDTGYARRCIFGNGVHHRADSGRSAAEIYAALTQPQNTQSINQWASHFASLANPVNFHWRLDVPDAVGIKLLEYKLACEKAAEDFPEHDEIKKAEISHRYFKALKLAGAYAFIDLENNIEMEHLLSAILLVEESGAAFQRILSREKSYVKLARFIANHGQELTHADLMENLPFFGKSQTQRNEQLNLATAWGYRNHIVIQKRFQDGIDFFKGETLKETDLNQMRMSYSDNWAYNYLNDTGPFDQLHMLTSAPGMHWCNHWFDKGHRAEENVQVGFNMLVLDVDGDCPLDIVHDLLQDYKFMTATTKRHRQETGQFIGGEPVIGPDRFRLIIPMNYELKLDTEDYKEFMNSIFAWLPFKVDAASNQRSKKWESNPHSQYHYNDGDLLDITPFIPKTTRADTFNAEQAKLGSLDNMERWFAARMVPGDRNNQMHRYAMALVDSGMSLAQVKAHVIDFNKKLPQPLADEEIDTTVMVTVAKRYKS